MPTINYENSEYEVLPGETVLTALLRQGCEITFSCGKGACAVCMQRCKTGTVPSDSQRGLKHSLVEKGYFLPCICSPTNDLSMEPPRAEDLRFVARIVAKKQVSADIVELLLEPEIDLSYRAGQFVNVIRDDGLTRSYSLASVYGEEPYLELHVQLVADGAMSNWLRNETGIDDELTLSGPFGDNFYRAAEISRDIVLLGTGSGLAPLFGIAKSAIYNGHKGDIHVYHAAATFADLYLHEELMRLSAEHAMLHYHPHAADENTAAGVISKKSSIVDVVFQERANIRDARIHVAGQPAMVDRCLQLARENSLSRESVVADIFTSGDDGDSGTSGSGNDHPDAHPEHEVGPRKFVPDPEMWSALGEGRLLREILDDFYTRVFEDPILSPYFRDISRQRVAEKVYSYLRQAFTGDRRYFGNHPKNAHHWMVIDNDIFDYRERMLADCMRRHGLPEHLVERWRILEEQFRGDIVKSKPQGRIVDGKELPVSGLGEIVLDFATLCDGCNTELSVGENVRYHLRVGSVYGDCCNDDENLADAI